ncbi:hypothetical protein [Sphingomonas abietis]|uniref:STAS/SEC14 domain-containing protein n=1 Tax=Sphingomonas abietis TaxID=3012344 RepID=A0ABY7NLX2_9SPHN|nr:hypothetical protein [Sphingomonas abietis]WBO22353.1 hypothetical protein PBT88_19805 [Sphingomonas abietis]
MFNFTIDPHRKLIRTTFSGFLTADEVMEWSRQEQAAVVAMGCGSGGFLLLVDSSGCAIQTQEVIGLFQQLVATSEYKARRIAIMRGSSLTRMQTRRIAGDKDYIGHFETITEAEEWLFADMPRAVLGRATAGGDPKPAVRAQAARK